MHHFEDCCYKYLRFQMSCRPDSIQGIVMKNNFFVFKTVDENLTDISSQRNEELR